MGVDTSPPSPIAWGPWILWWFTVMLAVIYLTLGVHLAIDSGQPVTVLLLAVWLPALALFAGGMTIVAAAARWVLDRFAPPLVRHSRVAAIVLGGLAGPLALLSFFATGDPSVVLEPRTALEGVVAPLTLGGGLAAHLAERRASSTPPEAR
ncbi:hypothetical protein [Egicoccus sp. AB-alg6-2]|uniref:hypothetical protein n=1 Tax=Egicoccus sp. AB-alg6-2 TaxID=3242692 RepID=UPI00359EF03A